jgi:hypothetical protein
LTWWVELFSRQKTPHFGWVEDLHLVETSSLDDIGAQTSEVEVCDLIEKARDPMGLACSHQDERQEEQIEDLDPAEKARDPPGLRLDPPGRAPERSDRGS